MLSTSDQYRKETGSRTDTEDNASKTPLTGAFFRLNACRLRQGLEAIGDPIGSRHEVSVDPQFDGGAVHHSIRGEYRGRDCQG
jgi:hypothetical protein